MSEPSPDYWKRQRAPALRALENLGTSARFAFIGPSVTGSQTVIRGKVLGPGPNEGVLVLVDETGRRRPAHTEWSGKIFVLPLEAT